MEGVPVQKFVTLTNNMLHGNMAKTTLSEVLQSDPVRRLLNQPNIVIKALPLNTPIPHHCASINSIISDKRNGMNTELNKRKHPEISIVPVKIQDDNEDANLLPSKNEGKSEIALLPIKREKRLCGHYEPCEHIVCDVVVQQYVDQNGVSPMLATNITEDEINAPVSKHCRNKGCDALSIDHNKCRRVLLKLHRCDKSNACDICGIPLKTPKSRIRHRHCTRKEEYRHNIVDSAELLRERMRQREQQLMEAVRCRRNDYLDPVTGYMRTMETLKRNEELIVIPKTAPSQCPQPVVTITSLSNNQTEQLTNNVKPLLGKTLSSAPVVLPQTSIIVSNKPQKDENQSASTKQSNVQDSVVTTFVTIPTITPVSTSLNTVPQNQFIKLTSVPQSNVTNVTNIQAYIQGNVQSVNLNDWLVSPQSTSNPIQTQVITTPIQPKPFLTPIRVVPITNLITQPSLLHQTQGIPKFCIMADNVVPPVTATSQPSQPARPLRPIRPTRLIQPAESAEPTESIKIESIKTIESTKPIEPMKSVQSASDINSTATSKLTAQNKRKKYVYSVRKKKKKEFVCNYCSKRFSTDWYFKMHVAKHKGEKLFNCNLCGLSFSDWYTRRKHLLAHENIRCSMCRKVCPTYSHYETHVKSHKQDNTRSYNCKECNAMHTTIDNLNVHRLRKHGKGQCKVCCKDFTADEFDKHMATHDNTDDTDLEMVQTREKKWEDDDSDDKYVIDDKEEIFEDDIVIEDIKEELIEDEIMENDNVQEYNLEENNIPEENVEENITTQNSEVEENLITNHLNGIETELENENPGIKIREDPEQFSDEFYDSSVQNGSVFNNVNKNINHAEDINTITPEIMDEHCISEA